MTAVRKLFNLLQITDQCPTTTHACQTCLRTLPLASKWYCHRQLLNVIPQVARSLALSSMEFASTWTMRTLVLEKVVHPCHRHRLWSMRKLVLVMPTRSQGQLMGRLWPRRGRETGK